MPSRTIVLPAVALLKNIPHKEHPLGRYLKGSRTIELSASELRKHDQGTRRFAVFHEIGHFWSVTVLGGEMGHATEEEFADAFATHFTDAKSLSPSYAAFLAKCFENNEASRMEAFAEGVLKSLETMLWKV